MALKDLASDLSAYKGQTTPTAIDSQIKEGVDFFPNDDASGFTPKTNLESLYNQVREGNIAKTWPEAAPTNDKTRQAFGQQGEYDVPDNVGRAVPSFLLNTDTLLGVKVQPQLLSPFLETPIADAVSMFNEDPFSVTLGTKSNPIRGDKRFNNRTYYYSGRQPAGLNGDFPFIPNAHGSDFMVTPIGSTSFSDPSLSLTHNVSMITLKGPTTETYQTSINVEPSIPNAHKIAVVNTDPNKTFDVTTMDDMVYGGYNLPEQKSSAGNATIDIIHDKRRGVYNEMVNTFFEHQPFPPFQEPNVSNVDESGAPLRYFSENNGKSIHISPEGELNAGFRYGAYQSEQFVNFNPGNQLTDVISAAPTAVGLGDRYSTYSNYPHINAEPPSNLIVGDETILAKWPDRAKTNLLSAFPSTEGNTYDIGTVITSNISDFFDKKSGVEKDGYDDLFEFSDGQFQNVPDGLSTNNKFGTKSYRSVANQGPFAGNDRHPFILREVGNNWGSDKFEAGSIGEIVGGLVTSGAPGLTGLIDRNFNDKIRVGKFLLSPQGLSFLTKQFIMQGLNPVIDTKIYNPISALGLVGVGQAGEAIGDAFNKALDGKIDLNLITGLFGGLAELATTIAFPIGQPERHLGGSRYSAYISDKRSPLQIQIRGKVAATYGRLAASAYAFGIQPKEVDLPEANSGIGFLDNYVNKKIAGVESTLENAQLVPTFALSNPNKYFFSISSAPKSVKNGDISFTGTADLALSDMKRARTPVHSAVQSEDGITRGGTFNEESNKRTGDKTEKLLTHFTLPYNRLDFRFGYENNLNVIREEQIALGRNTDEKNALVEGEFPSRRKAKLINDKIGKSIRLSDDAKINPDMATGGRIYGNTSSDNVDKVNILPIVDGGKLSTGNIPESITDNPDFIKFRFRDVINNKYLVFRALLSGITDTVTPEYTPHEYIGRPDKLYTYKGVDREVSFSFKIYPKTKQELPVLVEKMNYLVGMCYPSYTDNERMIAPFIELTLGDMFVDAPGLLNAVTVTVEDNTTWEIENGLQFPKHVSVQSTFKYIGKYAPVSLGKFYDIPWLSDNRKGDNLSGKPIGTYVVDPILKQPATVPSRKNGKEQDFTWINTITGNKLTDGIIQEEV